MSTDKVAALTAAALKRLSAVETAMPTVLKDRYMPAICHTHESRMAFVTDKLRTARHLTDFDKLSTPGPNPAKTYVSKDGGGNRLWFFATQADPKDLLYVMHLNPLTMRDRTDLGAKLNMYQGSVWRNRSALNVSAARHPSAVFWSLLSQRRNLFSDSLQSEDGKAFWELRIEEALGKGLEVYAVHFTDRMDILEKVRLHNGMDIQPYWTYEVDNDLTGMNWRFVIKHKGN